MALPTIQYPLYHTRVPTTNENVTFRPYNTGEEKALLIAAETGDEKSKVTTLKSIIKSCVENDLDVNDMASVDIEYLFIQIRSKAKGEIVELVMRCDETCTDYEKSSIDVEIDLSKIVVEMDEKIEKNIKLSDRLGIVMKYPSAEVVTNAKELSDEEIVIKCIDYIYDTDQVWVGKEATDAELSLFVRSLLPEQTKKVLEFFNVIPTLKCDFSYKCNVCGKVHDRTISGFSNFFI